MLEFSSNFIENTPRKIDYYCYYYFWRKMFPSSSPPTKTAVGYVPIANQLIILVEGAWKLDMIVSTTVSIWHRISRIRLIFDIILLQIDKYRHFFNDTAISMARIWVSLSRIENCFFFGVLSIPSMFTIFQTGSLHIKVPQIYQIFYI